MNLSSWPMIFLGILRNSDISSITFGTPLLIKSTVVERAACLLPTKTLGMHNDVESLDEVEHAQGAIRHTKLPWGRLVDHELRAWLRWTRQRS